MIRLTRLIEQATFGKTGLELKLYALFGNRHDVICVILNSVQNMQKVTGYYYLSLFWQATFGKWVSFARNGLR